MLLNGLRLAGFVALLWVVPALAQSSVAAPAWVAALRDGGYVIVVRHGATYADQADTNPLDPKDTAHQRQPMPRSRSLFWRRSGGGFLRRGNHADLLHHAHLVKQAPRFYDLPVGDLVDRHC